MGDEFNMEKTDILCVLNDFKSANGWTRSHDDIQSQFTVKLLELLGWSARYIIINKGQEVETGRKPDIILKDNAGSTILVIESKKADNKGRLNDRGVLDQLYEYCRAEGKYWGIITNFIEWRVYSIYHERLYNRKYAFHDLLWSNADRDDYIDLMSDEGIEFLLKLKRESCWKSGGKWDEADVYYPQEHEIRKEFFENLKRWRDELKKHLLKGYKEKRDENFIDLSSQKILDRLIFIEVCCDKDVIAEDILSSVVWTRGSIYRELKREFEHMNNLFNTGLFAEHWIDEIDIDNKVIEPIVRGVGATDFSRLSVHVIGEVYEQYIGEIQKKIGAYYTPEYIVDYIVQNTLGNILENIKTEDELKKIRVLDPACGSGSFLIRAFDEFESAYRRVLKIDEQYLFSFDYKRAILTDNLFGVDIDERAVEIAKLNLLLKALEGTKYQDLKGSNLLPDLSLNIRVGNSLIGGENLLENSEAQRGIFSDRHKKDIEQLKELRIKFKEATSDSERYKFYNKIFDYEAGINMELNEGLNGYFDDLEEIRAFNYTVSFPEVFEDGGFDAVIGNPPYIFTRELIKEEEKKYYNEKYKNTQFKINTYILFIEKSYNLLKKDSKFGFIVPINWLTLEYSSDFRYFILTKTFDIKIVNVDKKIFKSNVDNSILIFSKKGKEKIVASELIEGSENIISKCSTKKYLYTHNYVITYDIHSSKIKFELCYKVGKFGIHLNKIANVKNGVQAYTVGEGIPKQTKKMKEKRVYHSYEKKDETWIKYVDGVDVKRYFLGWSKKFIKYGKNLSRRRKPELFKGERILIRQIPSKPPYSVLACYVKENLINDNNSMIVKLKSEGEYKIEYILGILNSRLISFWFIYTFGKLQRKTFPQFKIKELSIFPIMEIDFNNPEEVEMHDEMVIQVERLMDLKKRYHDTKDGHPREQLSHEIEATDTQIDMLVYKLYNLTKDEIGVVEGGGND